MISMTPATCTIFFHNYYGEHTYWMQFFAQRIPVPFNLYYNVVEDSLFNLDSGLPGMVAGSNMQQLIIRRSPNRGKDIGGKMVLLDAYLRAGERTPFFVFLHDKTSPHKVLGREWSRQLLRIAEPTFAHEALESFYADRRVGIVAAASSIAGGDPGSDPNREVLPALQAQYDLHPGQGAYVAGTMFWARAQPLEIFFNAHPPLDIRRTLEEGNVMDLKGGTRTHSWERLLSWVVSVQGYNFKSF